jgi:hypothetical protein
MMPELILPDALVVDLSHWNAVTAPDFVQAKTNAGVVGIIQKFAQGGSPDPERVQYSYDAYEAGISLLGCYDFGTAADIASMFLSIVQTEYGGDLSTRLLMLDAERSSPQMSVADAEKWVQSIFDQEKRYPVLYMGKDGPDGTGQGLPSAILSQCDLMLPAYGDHADNLEAILPPGFRLPTSDTDRGGCLRLWQFTDGTINGGPIAGLGRCDQSRVIGFSSIAALTAWWGT